MRPANANNVETVVDRCQRKIFPGWAALVEKRAMAVAVDVVVPILLMLTTGTLVWMRERGAA